jgi:PAS domain S-box-containing protein
VNKKTIQKFLLSLLIPIIACAIQWVFWNQFRPFIWFLFYPAVFFSAQVGGRWGGVSAALLSIALAVFFFVEPIKSFKILNTNVLYSAGVFFLMGFLFSNLQERYRKEQEKSLDLANRRRADQALRAQSERLSLALESAQAGTWEWDLRTNKNFWSDELWKVYGLDPHSCEPSYEAWHNTIHPDDRLQAEQTVQAAAQNSTELRAEWRVVDRDGSIRWLMSHGRPILDTQGKPERFLGVVIDVTGRKRMEEELRRSNAELEQFAYVASHDLQEPLRAVAGMMQLLEQHYKGRLDERADEYISHAVEASTRMQKLITDLLDYSRVDRSGKPFEAANLESSLTSALRNLQAAIQESQAKISRDPLPTVMGDSNQLTCVFQNLIGNAIKFRGEGTPQIHIGAEKTENNVWHFSVCDNGIGIEPQYFERIFFVFQRLHTRREYPGTGIGLSLCKKIIERHGGKVWVESQPEHGSTFHFTIPEKKS